MFSIYSGATGRRARAGVGLAVRSARLAAGAALALGAVWAAPAWAQSGTLPPASQNPTLVWVEDFANVSTLPTPLNGYVGASGETATTGAGWMPSRNACNGWILSSTSSNPGAAKDSGCATGGGAVVGETVKPVTANPTAWDFLTAMAGALSTFNGGSQYVVASETNSTTAGYDGNQLNLTVPPAATADALLPNHYYAFSVDFAEVHCNRDGINATQKANWKDAVETVTATWSDGNSFSSGPVNPCTGIAVASTVGTIRELTVYSGVYQAPAGATLIGVTIQNSTSDFNGNDVAFSNFRLVDVTPQLYKSFNIPTAADGNFTVAPGNTATLTFTIQNTADNQEKAGWHFTDTLRGGLTVDSVIGTTCTNATVTAAAGSTTIDVTGTLAQGQASCTVQVQVQTPSGESAYPNGPNDITVDGLWPPKEVTLYTRKLVATKAVTSVSTDRGGVNLVQDVSGNPVVTAAGQYINYTIQVDNWAVAPEDIISILEETPDLFTGTGTAPFTPLSCSPSVTVPGTNAGMPGTTTCTAQYQVTTADLTTGAISNTATVMVDPPVPGTITNRVTTPILLPNLIIAKSVDSTQLVTGKTINFTFVVTNNGQLPVNNIQVTDGGTPTFPGTVTGITCDTYALNPGDQATCTGQYTVTAADVAMGTLTNVAFVSGTDEVYDNGRLKDLDPIGPVPSNPLDLTAAGAAGVTQVPTLDGRTLALLALMLGGLAWFAQRRMRR